MSQPPADDHRADGRDDVSSSPALLNGIHELTPAWIERALLVGSGVSARVSAVAALPIGTGQMAASYRVALTVEAPDGATPSSVVVKLAAGDEQTRRASAAGFIAEVAFYRDIAARVKARVPGCWYSDISPDGTQFVLVLEDLSAYSAGEQVKGCDVDAAKRAVANLALVHASFWNDAALDQALAFRPAPADPVAAAHGLGAVHVHATRKFLEQYGYGLSAEDVATLSAAAEATGQWLAGEDGATTLIHGDYRLDNLMFSPDEEVVTLDWQTFGQGNGGRDLAYFVACSFPEDSRATVEWDVIEEYHRALTAAGVENYSLEECRQDYRRGALQGPLITVLGAMAATVGRSEAGDQMFLSMAQRSCRAIRDLAVLELVVA